MDAAMTEPTPGASEPRPRRRTPKKKQESLPLFVLKLFLLALIVRSFVFAPFSIPSESMLPRLMNGDYLLAAKWPYGYSRYSLPFSLPILPNRVLASSPARGDAVIFKHPVDESDYIKRVVGLPGDTIEMRGGALHINTRKVAKHRIADLVVPVSPNTRCARPQFRNAVADGEAVCAYPRFRETLPDGRSFEVLDFGAADADDFGPLVVPRGMLFLVGDNRDNSMDSRFPAEPGKGIGLVPERNLVGAATIIMWSTDGSAEWLKPWTWFSAARWERIGATF